MAKMRYRGLSRAYEELIGVIVDAEFAGQLSTCDSALAQSRVHSMNMLELLMCDLDDEEHDLLIKGVFNGDLAEDLKAPLEVISWRRKTAQGSFDKLEQQLDELLKDVEPDILDACEIDDLTEHPEWEMELLQAPPAHDEVASEEALTALREKLIHAG